MKIALLFFVMIALAAPSAFAQGYSQGYSGVAYPVGPDSMVPFRFGAKYSRPMIAKAADSDYKAAFLRWAIDPVKISDSLEIRALMLTPLLEYRARNGNAQKDFADLCTRYYARYGEAWAKPEASVSPGERAER